MTIWEPFDPVSYFLHTVLGVFGIIGAIVALSVLKGSSNHVWAGRVFFFAAFVAATTAVVFGLTRFSGAALASSVMTFSALGAAVLALKAKSKAVFAGEIVTTAMMGLVLIWMGLGVFLSFESGAWLFPFFYGLFPLALFIGDIRFLRLDAHDRLTARLPRHYSRMAFAFAIAVHAPIVSFGDDLGIHPALAFFGPFILWPAIVILFNRRRAKGEVALATAR